MLLIAAPAANATTLAEEICSTLDREPNAVGVTIVAMSLLQAGASEEEAADLIVSSVQGVCPNNNVALRDFINRHQGVSYEIA